MGKPISGYILFSLPITCLFLIGVLLFITDHETNKCEMTYMFEYPQFVRIANKADTTFKKYELYAYSEGRVTERARNMHFDGIPVLFVPGNGGSYKQVRSLASVALRKALNSKTSFHFDYFTVNLNYELTGLNGGLLRDQMLYVNQSMYRVLELYSSSRSSPPKSVILVGHSMGGIIARYIAQKTVHSGMVVPIVITLSSAHTRPPLMSDRFMLEFYNEVTSTSSPVETTFVSISGGYNDFLVPAHLTQIKNNSISVTTTRVPKVWLPVDHLCILWCKQLVLSINRALFDSVDKHTAQITEDIDLRRRIFQHHLVHHTGTKASMLQQNAVGSKVAIDSQGQWIENLNRQYTVLLTDDVRTQRWYMVRLFDLPKYQKLTIVAVNLDVIDWVYACGAYTARPNYVLCKDGYSLTHLTEIIPSAKYKRKQIVVNLHSLRNKYRDEISHIAFRVTPTDDPVMYHVDVHSDAERKLQVELPSIVSLKWNTIIDQTETKAVTYNLQLPQLTHIWQSFVLDVRSLTCSTQQSHASATLRVPWDNQRTHKLFTETETSTFHLRLYSSMPLKFNRSAEIQLTLDPNCQYKVSIRTSLLGTMSQIVRFYSPMLLANIAAIILLTFSGQIQSVAQSDQMCIFFTAISHGAKPYYVLTAVKLVSKLLNNEAFRRHIPKPDWVILEQENTDFILLPLLMYLISVGLTWCLAIGLGVSLFVFESTAQRTALKFLAKTVTFNITFSDYLISGLKKLPFIVAGTLICLSITTCGGLALCLGAAFYFLKLTQISQDYIEGLIWTIIRKFAKKLKERLFKKKSSSTSESSADTTTLQALEQNSSDANLKQICDKTLENKDETNIVSTLDNTDEDGVGEESSPETSIEEIDDANIDEVTKESQENSDVTGDNERGKLVQRKSKLVLESKKSYSSEEQQPNEGQSSTDEQKEPSDPQEETINKHTEDKKKQEESLELQNELFFHATVFMLWVLVALINLPFVVTWAHNYKYSPILQPDPSFIPGIILSACSFPLWQLKFPRTQRLWTNALTTFLIVIAVISLIYAPVSIYRLSYTIPGAIALVIVMQLVAPSCDSVVSESSDNEDAQTSENTAETNTPTLDTETKESDSEEDVEEKYENIKTKIE